MGQNLRLTRQENPSRQWLLDQGCSYSAICKAHLASLLPTTHICLQLLLEIFIDVFNYAHSYSLHTTLTLPPVYFPSSSSSFFSYFYNTIILLPLIHAYCGIGNLSFATPHGKGQLLIAPKLRRSHQRLSLHAGFLACRSCAGNQSFCKLMCAIAMTCPEDSIFQHSSPSAALVSCPLRLPQLTLSLGKGSIQLPHHGQAHAVSIWTASAFEQRELDYSPGHESHGPSAVQC